MWMSVRAKSGQDLTIDFPRASDPSWWFDNHPERGIMYCLKENDCVI